MKNCIYLKKNDETLAKFDVKTGKCEIYAFQNSLPLMLQNKLYDTRRTGGLRFEKENMRAFSDFFKSRSITIERKNAEKVINAMIEHYYRQNKLKPPIPKPPSYEAIMIACHGLSVNDDFWITKNPNEKYKDFNVKENPLDDAIKQVALTGRYVNISKNKLVTPEGTTNGSQAKCWDREDDGKLYLYKASFQDREAEKEVMVSNILDCTNVPHVKYELAKKDGLTVSKCENLHEKTGLYVVSMIDINSYNSRNKDYSSTFLADTDVKIAAANISIVSYLTSDKDMGRERNVMAFIDPNTGKFSGIAPLSDFGDSFDERYMESDTPMPNCLKHNKSSSAKENALNAIEDLKRLGHPFLITAEIKREMFIDDKCYESFCQRATELGLMRPKTLKKHEMLAIAKGKEIDRYEAVCIKDDKYAEKYLDEYTIPDAQKEDYENGIADSAHKAISEAIMDVMQRNVRESHVL